MQIFFSHLKKKSHIHRAALVHPRSGHKQTDFHAERSVLTTHTGFSDSALNHLLFQWLQKLNIQNTCLRIISSNWLTQESYILLPPGHTHTCTHTHTVAKKCETPWPWWKKTPKSRKPVLRESLSFVSSSFTRKCRQSLQCGLKSVDLSQRSLRWSNTTNFLDQDGIGMPIATNCV